MRLWPRYQAVGRVYDVVSLEWLLYRAPRMRLLQLLNLAAGATVLDVGCGTGLNFPGTVQAIGPKGRLIGVDSSGSMLAGAQRRIDAAGWNNVTLIRGDAGNLLDLLARAAVQPSSIAAVIATYVLSVLDDDQPVWDALDHLARAHPLRVGIADIGVADTATPAARAAYRLLTALGGADPHRRPWKQLTQRGTMTAHEKRRHGHIHIATANYGK